MNECNDVGHLRSRDAMLLVQLIVKARRYFPASTTSEVLALLRPALCPFDQSYFTSQVYHIRMTYVASHHLTSLFDDGMV